jgi:hypothetical protein
MSLLSPSLRLLGIVAVSTVAVAACSSSDDNTGPSNTLAGSYTLASFESPPVPVLTPPTVSGTLVLTDTRYKATLSVPGVPAVDSGTYTASGTVFTMTSDVLPIQSVGTYTLTGNQLVTDLTTLGTRVLSTWTKQ